MKKGIWRMTTLSGPALALYYERMIVRFDIRPDQNGWTIYDRVTGRPAVIEGLVSVGLPFDDADDLVDLLNTLHMLKPQATLH
jgi:hypothetical protein